MENEISNEYIENAINELVSFFGTKEPVSGENIFPLIRSGKVRDAMKSIARQLNLPIDINITNVPNNYRPRNTQNSNNQFSSTHLVKVSQRGSRGSEGITAQVSIPGNLPFYGSSTLNGYPINVKISENCVEHPVVFSMIMAHELSHVLLHSLNHAQKDNEFYTDLTAIILGFQNIFQNGRKITTREEIPGFLSTTIRTTTTSYGYLSDDQFSFAYNKIEKALSRYKKAKNKLADKIKKLERKLTKDKRIMIYFQKYLEYVDKNLHQKMSREDGYRISTFHQAGYTDEFEQAVRKTESELKQFNTFIQNLNRYDENLFSVIKQYEEKIYTADNNLNSKYDKLRADVDIFKRYTPFGYKLKVFFKVYFGN